MSYNDAPSDEIFNEIKEAAIEIWKTYDDRFGYATEKIEKVNSVQNVGSNWGFLVGMFDQNNQALLLNKLSLEARAKVEEWL